MTGAQAIPDTTVTPKCMTSDRRRSALNGSCSRPWPQERDTNQSLKDGMRWKQHRNVKRECMTEGMTSFKSPKMLGIQSFFFTMIRKCMDRHKITAAWQPLDLCPKRCHSLNEMHSKPSTLDNPLSLLEQGMERGVRNKGNKMFTSPPLPKHFDTQKCSNANHM